jgi:hypothetical protein
MPLGVLPRGIFYFWTLHLGARSGQWCGLRPCPGGTKSDKAVRLTVQRVGGALCAEHPCRVPCRTAWRRQAPSVIWFLTWVSPGRVSMWDRPGTRPARCFLDAICAGWSGCATFPRPTQLGAVRDMCLSRLGTRTYTDIFKAQSPWAACTPSALRLVTRCARPLGLLLQWPTDVYQAARVPYSYSRERIEDQEGDACTSLNRRLRKSKLCPIDAARAASRSRT